MGKLFAIFYRIKTEIILSNYGVKKGDGARTKVLDINTDIKYQKEGL